MKGERRDKNKHQDESRIREKCEHDSSEFFLVHFIEINRPLAGRVPKCVGRDEIEQREYAQEKSRESSVFYRSNSLAFHCPILTEQTEHSRSLYVDKTGGAERIEHHCWRHAGIHGFPIVTHHVSCVVAAGKEQR